MVRVAGRMPRKEFVVAVAFEDEQYTEMKCSRVYLRKAGGVSPGMGAVVAGCGMVWGADKRVPIHWAPNTFTP